MRSSVTKLSGLFYLTNTGGKVIKTPAGHPVGCHDKQIVELVADAYHQFGSEPKAACSLYALICTYLDFGGTPRGELINILLRDLEDDIVYREVAMLTAMDDIDTTQDDVLESPWPNTYLRASGFYDHWEVESRGFARAINYPKISGWLLKILETLPPRAIITLRYCATNFGCLLPTLALLSSNYPAEDFKELVEDRVNQRETDLIDHLRAFAALPEDRDAVIGNIKPSTV